MYTLVYVFVRVYYICGHVRIIYADTSMLEQKRTAGHLVIMIFFYKKEIMITIHLFYKILCFIQ